MELEVVVADELVAESADELTGVAASFAGWSDPVITGVASTGLSLAGSEGAVAAVFS